MESPKQAFQAPEIAKDTLQALLKPIYAIMEAVKKWLKKIDEIAEQEDERRRNAPRSTDDKLAL